MVTQSQRDEAALKLIDNFNQRDERLVAQIPDVQKSILRHTGKGYHGMLESSRIDGPTHKYYLFSIAEDVQAVDLLKKNLPVLLTEEPRDAALFATMFIVHMRTLEGQAKAVALYREAIKGQEETYQKLESYLALSDKDHLEDRDRWTKKFGINPFIENIDVVGAMAAYRAVVPEENKPS